MNGKPILLWSDVEIFKPEHIFISDFVYPKTCNGKQDFYFCCPCCNNKRITYLRAGSNTDRFEEMAVQHMRMHTTTEDYFRFFVATGLLKIISKLKNNKCGDRIGL